MDERVTVISLGGSVISPEAGLDKDFIRDFRSMINGFLQQGHRFVITVGGGSLARTYQAAAKDLGTDESEDLDMIGIAALSVHVRLISAVFNSTDSVVVTPSDFSRADIRSHSIVLITAQSTGRSTDYNAVTAADTINSGRVINISDVGYVYDADPDTNADAQQQSLMSWKEYLDMIPGEFTPGMHLPIGPPAARAADENRIKMSVVGDEIDQIAAAIAGANFSGTLLR